MTKDTILIHHSAIPGDKPQFDQILAYHNSGAGGKIRKGRGLAYHFFCGKDGTVKQAHDEDFVGDHAGNYMVNVRSIGICLAGDFTVEDPTERQLLALARLLTDLQQRWGIPDDRVLLHGEVRMTECPGKDLRQLAFETRQKMLADKIPQLEKALERAKGSRKAMLSRLIDRLQKLFPTTDSPV